MAKVYICSPFRSETAEGRTENVERAKRLCRKATLEGHTILCPHLLYPQFLDDDNPKEREIGMAAGLRMMETADEVWVASGPISEGMSREIARAGELDIPTRCVVDPLVADEHLLLMIEEE